METLVKIDISKLKNDIQTGAEKQKFYRNQRKDVHLVGTREMPASEATYEHHRNGEILRAMYAAYGLARGKCFSVTENHYPEENHPLNKLQWRIDNIMNDYPVKEEI